MAEGERGAEEERVGGEQAVLLMIILPLAPLGVLIFSLILFLVVDWGVECVF